MVLERLTLRNVGIHKSLTVKFSPTVTTIVGPNGSGKSTIVRALRWIALNQPLGQGLIRWGRSLASASLVIDGKIVTRKRGKGKNCYTIDGKLYKAMGATVPDPVSRLLNINPTNFQRQLDGPFWFSKSPGQVSKELNAVVNLSAIDDALSSVASEVRKARSVVDVTQQRLAEAVRKRRESVSVQEFSREVSALSTLQTQIDGNASKIAGIASGLENRRILQERVRDATPAILDAENAISACERAIKGRERIERLDSLLGDYLEKEGLANDPLPDLEGIDALASRAEERGERIRRLEGMLCDMTNKGEEIKKLDQSIPAMEHRLRKMMGGRCPVCAQKLPS